MRLLKTRLSPGMSVRSTTVEVLLKAVQSSGTMISEVLGAQRRAKLGPVALR